MKQIEGRALEKAVFAISLRIRLCRSPSACLSLLVDPSLPYCFKITSLLYLQMRAHQWPRKFGFCEFPFWKGTSLRRDEAEAFEFCSSGSLLCTSSTSVVHLSVIFSYVLFFCLLAALLIPTSPYSIEQYDMRD